MAKKGELTAEAKRVVSKRRKLGYNRGMGYRLRFAESFDLHKRLFRSYVVYCAFLWDLSRGFLLDRAG
jgi:hypothetical protein